MSLTNKSAADIQAIIDAALAKKPALPKGLEEEIANKKAAVEAKKAAKAEAEAKANATESQKKISIEKTLGKAVTATKLDPKTAKQREKMAKKTKEKKATMKAVKKGSVAVAKKKRLDALQKLRLKEARKERKQAKRRAALEKEEKDENKKNKKTPGGEDEDFDSDLDGSLFDDSDEENDIPFTDSDDEHDPEGAAALKQLKQKEMLEKVMAKTISGVADKDALAEDPLAATFGGVFGGMDAMRDATTDAASFNSTTIAAKKTNAPKRARDEEGGNDDEEPSAQASVLLRNIAAEKASEYVPQDKLLTEAHKLFAELSETERKRNAFARKKIAEMKAINKRGGDKDGFKYVLPTSIKSYARQLAGDGHDIPEDLASHFLGDGIQDTMKAPSRKKDKKRYHDDFYSFQIAKKWTKNAENFLNKAKKTKNMFISRQQKLRTTKKM